MMVEEFKHTLPEKVATYLNEHKVETLSQAAVRADEFVLTHKSFANSTPCSESQEDSSTSKAVHSVSGLKSKDERVCYFCRKPGHVIAECRTMQKQQRSSGTAPSVKSNMLVHSPQSDDE